MLKKLAPTKGIRGVLYSTNMEKKTQFYGSCAYANRIPKQQYLWTWCQSVVTNNGPRDFGPEVAFGANFQTPVARKGGREEHVAL